MKKLTYFALLLITIVLISAAAKRNYNSPRITEKIYKIIPAETTVSWTAFKTTDKVPVSGIFKEVIIDNEPLGKTVFKAFDGVSFSLPVSSIFSQSKLRDGKIKKSFFGEMLNTSKISGTIKLTDNNTGLVKITMNGISNNLPISYKIENQQITIEAVMDVNNWQAQAALEVFSEACEDLHTGVDGETKTWSEVSIKVISKLKLE